nr:uncharacterized protein CTRU02_12619 [Colletotrichum truncatum]XP_036580233.1 uncharacterized protein CTRU02_09878 [Colletotrichum truncatum]XP_036586903.1 uncharacterized protein CTRU02_03491 [Colletotrichum truncatum]KAF6784357.1 hypothetical protein CTRU02_12619 [Colletotrichum truncatum]KAF6788065.1 hypothetical protein CTRU02_09878 [Colletotrichum truncatum]KAF6797460.1 hypothetical protein CTRU02_03491 [Colletotrichum truncatum]
MEDLPPFEFNEAGEVKLAPGELYCRWGGRSSSITCTKTERFSSESNLKNHIKKHKLDGVPAKVKSRKSGANSVEENDDAAEFYDRIHGIAIGARDDSELQTPSKKRKAQTPPPLLAVQFRTNYESIQNVLPPFAIRNVRSGPALRMMKKMRPESIQDRFGTSLGLLSGPIWNRFRINSL